MFLGPKTWILRAKHLTLSLWITCGGVGGAQQSGSSTRATNHVVSTPSNAQLMASHNAGELREGEHRAVALGEGGHVGRLDGRRRPSTRPEELGQDEESQSLDMEEQTETPTSAQHQQQLHAEGRHQAPPPGAQASHSGPSSAYGRPQRGQGRDDKTISQGNRINSGAIAKQPSLPVNAKRIGLGQLGGFGDSDDESQADFDADFDVDWAFPATSGSANESENHQNQNGPNQNGHPGGQTGKFTLKHNYRSRTRRGHRNQISPTHAGDGDASGTEHNTHGASGSEQSPVHDAVTKFLTGMWENFAEPLLFGVIGFVLHGFAQNNSVFFSFGNDFQRQKKLLYFAPHVDFGNLDYTVLHQSVLVVCVCVFCVRVPAAFFATGRLSSCLPCCGGGGRKSTNGAAHEIAHQQDQDLNCRERVFIGLAWLPKATVQAALGSVPLDMLRERDFPNRMFASKH